MATCIARPPRSTPTSSAKGMSVSVSRSCPEYVTMRCSNGHVKYILWPPGITALPTISTRLSGIVATPDPDSNKTVTGAFFPTATPGTPKCPRSDCVKGSRCGCHDKLLHLRCARSPSRYNGNPRVSDCLGVSAIPLLLGHRSRIYHEACGPVCCDTILAPSTFSVTPACFYRPAP